MTHKKIIVPIFATLIFLVASMLFAIPPIPTSSVSVNILSAANPAYTDNNCDSPDDVRNEFNAQFVNTVAFLNTPNNFFGVGNPTYYFQGGSFNNSFCADDGTGNLFNAQPLSFSATLGTGFSLWLDLPSQCHECHNAGFTGTWWKLVRFVSAAETRQANAIEVSQIRIENQRTNCNLAQYMVVRLERFLNLKN